MKMVLKFVAVIAFLAAAVPASAIPIVWVDNGHYYEAIAAPNGISWTDAAAAAAATTYLGATGHLATLTSVAENAFVDALSPGYYILGGSQSSSASAVNTNWSWVTGEPWSFTSWNSPPEPNDGGDGVENGEENYLHFWATSTWNDFTGSPQSGYIVEYEPSRNGDNPVPEPTSMLLLGTGLVCLARRRFANKRKC